MTASRAPARRNPPAADVPLPAAFAVGVAFAAAIVVTLLAVAVGATHDPEWALLPLGLVTAGTALLTSWTGGVAAAWICWALDSGFIIGRTGQLNFTGPAQAAVLVLLAVALAAGSAGHWSRGRR